MEEEIPKKFVITVHWKDDTEEYYHCEFFGVSPDSPNLFIVGNIIDEERTPSAFISVKDVWKIGVETLVETPPPFVPTIVKD